jgi:hypothetical protein
MGECMCLGEQEEGTGKERGNVIRGKQQGEL